ncbi:hypothetical protein COU57_02945 [Candidatus Pacearchaeota archaeon CG10_big_fil_rev_8_21_14_0_10_32_14]|nr:MAG: hypothetical protein COU57_02945 [Candidatus Pacearchaeota archaeon CG10_big_fil_rev_8_21_14_0_10_32_14]
MNLCKIASNYLNDVPLLRGGIGDAGDMQRAEIYFDETLTDKIIWNPPEIPSFFHFVFYKDNDLTIDTVGQYNNVDTFAQGYQRIEPAYKPNLSINFKSNESDIPLIFGGIYNTDLSQDFWEDNVGITPIILQGQTDLTGFGFDVSFQSDADIEPKHFSFFNLSNEWHNTKSPMDLIEVLGQK